MGLDVDHQLPDLRRGGPVQAPVAPLADDPVPVRVVRPAVTAADTTGTYSAKVGTSGWCCGTVARSAGVRPIRSSSTSAASTTACWVAVGCAAGFVAVTAAPLRRAGTGHGPASHLVHHRKRVGGQPV